VADGFAPKNNHYVCKSREGNGDLRGCAENFPRFHANPVCSAKCDLMRRKAYGSLKSLVLVRFDHVASLIVNANHDMM